MAIAGIQLAGKGAGIDANGVSLSYAKWECTDESEKIDTTNFDSSDGAVPQGANGAVASYAQATFGVEAVKHNGSGLFDASLNPFDDPPAFYPTDDFADLTYYLNRIANIFWSFPVALLLSTTNGAEVRGAVSFAWSGESNGPFTRPTGSI